MATKAKAKPAAAATKPAAVGGMAARLASLGAAKASSSKSSGKPNVKLTCEAEIKAFGEELRKKKDAEAKMADLHQIIAEEAEEQRISLSRKAGQVETSLRLNNILTFVSGGSRYCGMPLLDSKGNATEIVEKLTAVFGNDYERFFMEGVEVKVKAESLTDDLVTALNEACEKVGVSFGDVFESKGAVVAQESLTSARILDDKVKSKFDLAVSQGLIKPYKDTIKE